MSANEGSRKCFLQSTTVHAALCYSNHFLLPRKKKCSCRGLKKFFIIYATYLSTYSQYYYQVCLIRLYAFFNLPFPSIHSYICHLPYSYKIIYIFPLRFMHTVQLHIIVVNFIFMKMTIYVMCKLFHANVLHRRKKNCKVYIQHYIAKWMNECA